MSCKLKLTYWPYERSNFYLKMAKTPKRWHDIVSHKAWAHVPHTCAQGIRTPKCVLAYHTHMSCAPGRVRPRCASLRIGHFASCAHGLGTYHMSSGCALVVRMPTFELNNFFTLLMCRYQTSLHALMLNHL